MEKLPRDNDFRISKQKISKLLLIVQKTTDVVLNPSQVRRSLPLLSLPRYQVDCFLLNDNQFSISPTFAICIIESLSQNTIKRVLSTLFPDTSFLFAALPYSFFQLFSAGAVTNLALLLCKLFCTAKHSHTLGSFFVALQCLRIFLLVFQNS